MAGVLSLFSIQYSISDAGSDKHRRVYLPTRAAATLRYLLLSSDYGCAMGLPEALNQPPPRSNKVSSGPGQPLRSGLPTLSTTNGEFYQPRDRERKVVNKVSSGLCRPCLLEVDFSSCRKHRRGYMQRRFFGAF
ncbi:hypothetical protein BR93DRAFT_925352 [Coniochaeta sp. PMI_546]|nr:hypothetical protein BR93DRAFT_925352 [Coniochaeta sp. PMI_546]